MKGKLFIISAPSGAGKTTLCHRLLESHKGQIEFSISSTTRPPRPGEENGREYYFISEGEFKSLIEKGEFAEWAKVHDQYYGTSKTAIESVLNEGRSVLLDIDVQGADELVKVYPDQTVTIFIVPPNISELRKRLKGRGTDAQDIIAKRIQNAIDELDRATDFDHTVINDDLDRAYSELDAIVKKAIESGSSG